MNRRTSRRKSAGEAKAPETPELETETLSLGEDPGQKEYRSRKKADASGSAAGAPGGSLLPVFLAGAILLAVVIGALVFLMKGRKEPEVPETEPVTEAVTETAPVPDREPEECRIPEISMLVNAYFNARANADTARMKELFGRQNTAPDEELAEKLLCQKTWIQEYRDIHTYLFPGLEGDSRFAVITYTIDMRRTDADAPGVMYAYFTKDADGQYIFTENLNKERQDYIRAVLENEKAKALVDAQDEALRKALSENSNLALIYTSFLNGEIYRETDLDTDREQIVDFSNPEDSILVDRRP